MKIRKTRAERKLERQNRESQALMSKLLKGDYSILAKEGDPEAAARSIRNTDWGQKVSKQVARERCIMAVANGELTKYVDRGGEVFLETNLARAKRAERESKRESEQGSNRAHLTSMAAAR